jgi:hypothetical protein
MVKMVPFNLNVVSARPIIGRDRHAPNCWKSASKKAGDQPGPSASVWERRCA